MAVGRTERYKLWVVEMGIPECRHSRRQGFDMCSDCRESLKAKIVPLCAAAGCNQECPSGRMNASCNSALTKVRDDKRRKTRLDHKHPVQKWVAR